MWQADRALESMWLFKMTVTSVKVGATPPHFWKLEENDKIMAGKLTFNYNLYLERANLGIVF